MNSFVIKSLAFPNVVELAAVQVPVAGIKLAFALAVTFPLLFAAFTLNYAPRLKLLTDLEVTAVAAVALLKVNVPNILS